MQTQKNAFLNVLTSAERSAEIPESDDLYGWLIGSWEQDFVIHDPELQTRSSRGEAHFAWVLEGRAIQDVWINPRREDRSSRPAGFAEWYGSTLRIYQPASREWRITWRDPHSGVYMDQIGRRNGRDIVQEGIGPDGATYRWTFSEITQKSFTWTGEVRRPNKTRWTIQLQIKCRRMDNSG